MKRVYLRVMGRSAEWHTANMSTRALEVTVTGHGEATYPPERCTVHLTISFDGPDRQRTHAKAAETAGELKRRITALHDSDSGPVNWWALDQMRTSQHRPFNKDGRQLPYVYRTAAALEVKFSQLAEVDEFVNAASLLEGVTVDYLDWALTTKSRADKVIQVRDLAVRDASDKAKAYASSLGRAAIEAVAVADPGLLGVESSGHDSSPGARAYAMTPGGLDDSISLKPENITLTADVEARFEAR